ncbi:MAG TPA: hypothetical protein VMR31_17155 [Myxococcota bacterium]|nr:hypothetical protein [Myxococcota bacterium]
MTRLTRIPCLALAALWLAPRAFADDPKPPPATTDAERARDDEIADLKNQLATVVNEVEALRAQLAAPEEATTLTSQNGFGPAASKVYQIAKGVSIGGYLEGHYAIRGFGDARQSDEMNLDREVLYVGYKFNDWMTWNSELEFENGGTERGGSVAVEFSTLDFLFDPRLNGRVGVLLLPMGITNEVHEPPFYYSTFRSAVETQIIPGTWAEYGAGFFGNLGESLSYRIYMVDGLNALGYNSAGFADAPQGASQARADDLAFVGRVDFHPLEGLNVGGSYFVGGAGQGQKLDISGTEFKVPKARTSIWELHSTYRWRGLTTNAMFAMSRVANAGQLSELFTLNGNEEPVISRRMFGGYVEVAYDIMPLIRPGSEMSLEPFFRWEYLDTQNDVPLGFEPDLAWKQRIWVPGIQFKPIPNIVFKLDYRNVDDFANKQGDQVDIGFGLVF